jgi:hypothetical protein
MANAIRLMNLLFYSAGTAVPYQAVDAPQQSEHSCNSQTLSKVLACKADITTCGNPAALGKDRNADGSLDSAAKGCTKPPKEASSKPPLLHLHDTTTSALAASSHKRYGSNTVMNFMCLTERKAVPSQKHFSRFHSKKGMMWEKQVLLHKGQERCSKNLLCLQCSCSSKQQTWSAAAQQAFLLPHSMQRMPHRLPSTCKPRT